jgi:5-methylcytosine-specific restriction protein B
LIPLTGLRVQEPEFRNWLKAKHWKDAQREPKTETNYVLRCARAEAGIQQLGFNARNLEELHASGKIGKFIHSLHALIEEPDSNEHALRLMVPKADDPRGQLYSMIAALRMYERFLDFVASGVPLAADPLQVLHDAFLTQAPEFTSFPDATDWPARERVYKDRTAQEIKEILASDLNDDECGNRICRALYKENDGPLVTWQVHQEATTSPDEVRVEFHSAIVELARSKEPAGIALVIANTRLVELRNGGFKSLTEGARLNYTIALWGLLHPNEGAPFKITKYKDVFKRLGIDWPFEDGKCDAQAFQSFTRALTEIKDALNERWDWQARDLIDVQTFLWIALHAASTEVSNNPNASTLAVSTTMPGPTNLILYGPPGTGKTYQTAKLAVELCDGTAPSDATEIKMRYSALANAGQIAFVTFHQSYAYEDFVEGLRPQTGGDGEDGSGAGFRLDPKQGVFREIAALADHARRNARRGNDYDFTGRQFFKMSLGRAGVEDHIYDAAIDGGYVVLGWGGEVDWSPKQFDDYQAVFAKWNEIEPGTSGNAGNISQVWRFRSSMREGDIVVISDGNLKFRAIGEIVGPYEFNPTGEGTYNHRRKVKWLLVLDESLPVDTIHDGQFSQASCYLLKHTHVKIEALARLLPGSGESSKEGPDQFVLIIDEINRANISKVFGELITLIESDKRLGEENELTLKLPYSGEPFGVPNNLHIIGTMNTADRSIALLDTALRRRFNFRELMPDPSTLSLASERTGIDLSALLQTINDRVEYLFDREHQIGHAYFIHCHSLADLHDVMRYRIIPLLAEYFYEDWSKVALVLGDAEGAENFIKRTKLTAPAGMSSGGFEEDRYRWEVCEQFADSAYVHLT